MSATAVETGDLTKVYRDLWRRPTPALAGVSVRVEQGVIFGLLGPNGAGKTTLVKILLGLLRSTGGWARVLGRNPSDARTRRSVGYLPEQMRLPEFMKAEGFLRYMGRLNRVDRATLAGRIPQLLDLVDLAGIKKRIQAYSKGMQQRLGLAQALLNDPDLLFLDEPTEGLDPLGRKQVRGLLIALRAGGKTIFLNSHLLSEVEQVCDQIVILRRGQIAGTGRPADFIRATGQYRIRLAAVTGAVRSAAEAVVGPAIWDGNSFSVAPRDRAHLNELIDRLRSLPVEIETIEAVRSTLEESFIEVVTESES